MPVNTPLSAITDTAIALLPAHDYGKWSQIAQTYTDYFFWRTFLKQNKVTVAGGDQIKWNLLHDKSSNAGSFGIAQTIDVDMPSGFKQCTCPWVRKQQSTMLDIQEMHHLRSGAEIFDYIEGRRQIDRLALIELLEAQAVALPTTSTDGDTDMRGLPYYCPVNSSTGFNGGNPSGHSACAGQNSSVVTRWNNYTAQYTAVTYADLIDKMRVGADETGFMAPDGLTNTFENMKRLCITTRAVRRAYEDEVRSQNESIGVDAAFYDNKAVFRQNPVISVPILETLTGERMYMLDLDTWEFKVLQGADMVKLDPWMAPAKPTTKIVTYILTANMICKDRRKNAVFATSAASNGT